MCSLRSRCWQMTNFENSSTLSFSQWLATTHVSCLITVKWKEGRSYLQAKEVRNTKEHLLNKNPQARKLIANSSGTKTSCLFTFWLLPTLQLCHGACFSVKRSLACYAKCHCVLSVAAGACSDEEVNDQQATVVTAVQMDASKLKLLI